MKTSIIIFFIAGTLLLTQTVHAGKARLTYDSTGMKNLADAKMLLKRLDIINAADKTDFNSQEKKQLRKEARNIKGNLRELRGARYISGGVIIVILAIPFSVYQLTE